MALSAPRSMKLIVLLLSNGCLKTARVSAKFYRQVHRPRIAPMAKVL